MLDKRVVGIIIVGFCLFFAGESWAEEPSLPFQSVVTTQLWTENLNLDPVQFNAKLQGYEVVEYKSEKVVIQFSQSTNDYAYIHSNGYIMVGSLRSLIGLGQKDILEAELFKMVELVKSTMAGVTTEKENYSKYYATIFYGDPVGIYHRIILKGKGGFRWTLSVPKCKIKKARVTSFCEDPKVKLEGEKISSSIMRYGRLNLSFSSSWRMGEALLDILTSPVETGFAIGGWGAENVIIRKNRSIEELSEGQTLPQIPESSNFASAITTNFQAKLNLRAVFEAIKDSESTLQAIECSTNRAIFFFPETTGDFAYLYNSGYIMVASQKGLSGIGQKDILQTELFRVVDAIKSVSAGVSDEQIYHIKFHRTFFYGEPEGIYHRVILRGKEDFRWALSVPKCEVKEARTLYISERQAELRIEGKESKKIGGRYRDSTGLLRYGNRNVTFGARYRGWCEEVLEIFTSPAQTGFFVSGPGSEKVIIRKNLSMKKLKFSIEPERVVKEPEKIVQPEKIKQIVGKYVTVKELMPIYSEGDKIIGVARPGEKFRVLGLQGDRYLVEFTKPGQKGVSKGWISKKAVKVVK